MRPILVLIHRYVGLLMAGFLLLAGLTGALLAFNYELDSAISPELMRVEAPAANVQPLPPLLLRDKVLAAYPQAEADWLPLRREPGRADEFWIYGKEDPKTGEHAELAVDQVFVNPYSGEILGARKWGDISAGAVNLLPFVYRIHYTLLLDEIGKWLMGIIAILWVIDCFAGVYLTLPARQRKAAANVAAGKNWWQRWAVSWRVRWQGGNYKLNFDLHRAGALWLWLLLLVIALSSVSFNLPQYYRPVISAAMGMQAGSDGIADLAEEKMHPGMAWPQALARGQQLMQEMAQREAFLIERDSYLYYDHHKGIFGYAAYTSRDLDKRWGRTAVFFDADHGQLRATYIPTGHTAGDTFTSWIATLHMAAMWGLSWQLVMLASGIGVAMLSLTGVYIWWKKRRARHKAAQARPAGLAAAEPQTQS